MHYLENSAMIITHGGHSTIMECLWAGVPIFGVPLPNICERVNNLKKIQKLGLGYYEFPNRLSSVGLEYYIDLTLELKDKVKKFSKYVRKFDGVKNAVEYIKSIIS